MSRADGEATNRNGVGIVNPDLQSSLGITGAPPADESKNYRRYYDRLMDERIEELVMREEPVMLTEVEVDLPAC